MQLVHAVLNKRIHITKRDLFYTDVKLFVDQAESDGVLDDVATMIGCTRSNLNVVASDKGLVVGRIQFEEDGDPIDCTRMGVGGKAIPPYIDKIENIRSDAEFVLLVEKEAAYMRMAVSLGVDCDCWAGIFCCRVVLTDNLSLRDASGRSILPQVSLHCDYSKGTTRCCNKVICTDNGSCCTLCQFSPSYLECFSRELPLSFKFQSWDWWIRILMD